MHVTKLPKFDYQNPALTMLRCISLDIFIKQPCSATSKS